MNIAIFLMFTAIFLMFTAIFYKLQEKKLNIFDRLDANESRKILNTNNLGLNAMVGKKCIIRTYSAGVWFGEIEQKSGNEVIVKNARRMWQWWAAKSISLSGVAVYGIKQNDSKIAPAVASVWLEAIELIPCTDVAIESIEGAKDVEAQ